MVRVNNLFMLCTSFSLGVLLATLTITIHSNKYNWSNYWRNKQDLYVERQTQLDNFSPADNTTSWDNEDIAEQLRRKVRIFCWILTTPDLIQSRGYYVNKTWAKRCTKYVFMSTKENSKYPVVALKVEEKRENLWHKTKAAFEYVHDHYLNDFDFFLKADDDTYMIMENLRYLLKDLNPDEPHYAGREFYYKDMHVRYMSGGAGYVLSREALKRFIQSGTRVPSNKNCNQATEFEDLYLGQCVLSLGARIIPSIDSWGLERFYPLQLTDMLQASQIPDWLPERNHYKFGTCLNCISNLTISFHYTQGVEMLRHEFLIYHLKPYGIIPFQKLLNNT